MSSSTTSMADSATARLTVFLCFLATFCEGIDLQAAGLAAAGIRAQYHPDPQLLSYFFSASTLGLFLGALVGGRLADRLGRKSVLVAAVGVFGVFSLLTTLAGDITMLTLARFLTGLGLGGALPNVLSIGSENATANRRSASVTMIYAGMPLGGAFASVISLLTSAAQWRWIFIAGGVVPLLVAPAIKVWLPESLAFSRLKALTPQITGTRSRLFGFIEDGRLPRTLLLWASFFLALLTLYLLLNWLPTLLAGSGLAKSAVAIGMIGFNLGGGIAALYVGAQLETQLRHWGVLTVFVGMPLLLLWLASGPQGEWLILAVVFGLGAAVVAAQAILYAFAPSVYPTRARGTGVGFAVAVGRIGSIVGPLLGGVLVGSGRSSSQVLAGMMPIVIVGSLCAIVLAWRQPPAQPD
jgi:MFS transporter, AAHS family, 3-hydroxyphenylpropionic acid transporter